MTSRTPGGLAAWGSLYTLQLVCIARTNCVANQGQLVGDGRLFREQLADVEARDVGLIGLKSPRYSVVALGFKSYMSI